MDWSGQAVVLGGGVAGMLAARVLADTFEQVTIIERHAYDLAGQQDDRPAGPPALAYALSERARPQLERFFPNLSAELTANGAATGAAGDGDRLQFTQQFIQRHLSRRMTSLDAITTLRGRDAVGLVSDGQRCVGVQILPRSHSAAARSIPADLVVDAMGAGSRLCVWLDEVWRIRIPKDREDTTMHYASRPYRLRAGSLSDAIVVDPRPAHPYRTVITAIENGNHLVAVGCPGSSPLNDHQFNQLVSTHVSPTVAAAIAGGRPVAPVSAATYAQIGRRRFDRAPYLPAGVVALGGSVCCFDPLYQPDFDVAVLEAAALGRILGDQHWYANGNRSIELPRRYFRAVRQILEDTCDTARPPR
jgi:hypothetical protein